MQSEVIASKQCNASMWDPGCHNREMLFISTLFIDPSTQLGVVDLEVFFFVLCIIEQNEK